MLWIHSSISRLSSAIGCAWHQGLKTHHVSLFLKSICSKSLLSLSLEVVDQNSGLLKISFIWTQKQKPKVRRWGFAHEAKLFSLHPHDALPVWATFFLCSFQAFNCACLLHSPFNQSSSSCIYLVSGWKTLCHGKWILNQPWERFSFIFFNQVKTGGDQMRVQRGKNQTLLRFHLTKTWTAFFSYTASRF